MLDIPVLSLESLPEIEKEVDVIVIASGWEMDIYRQLKERNVKKVRFSPI